MITMISMALREMDAAGFHKAKGAAAQALQQLDICPGDAVDAGGV